MIRDAINKLIHRSNLSAQESELAMDDIMSGRATPAQIGAFLAALRMKKETSDEIASFASVMRNKSVRISPKGFIVDTCGTGGDNSSTFNISTAAAIVAAGSKIKIAKHGNRSVSSQCGSADVLEELGVNISLEPAEVKACIEDIGIGFMFAPIFHKAMKHAIGPRRELGIRTVFNLLGPLTNPAGAKAQVVGVYEPDLTETVAEVLGRLGVEHALAVHGQGLDEITLSGTTKISEYKDSRVLTYTISPEDFGLKQRNAEDYLGGPPKVSAMRLMEVLTGKDKGPRRDIVVINAAAAIYAGRGAESLKAAVANASESIDSGAAKDKLDELRAWTNIRHS